MTVAGVEKGEDGRFRSATTFTVAGKEGDVAHIEMRRGETLASEEWWSLTAKGLHVTQQKVNDQTRPYDPPLPMIAFPLRSPHKWTYRPKDKSPQIEYRMWGALPVKTPSAEMPGWIVLMRTVSGREISTIERHYAKGVGVVREVHVDAVGPELLMRVEAELLPAK